jgi:hypothetical protein
VQPRLFVPGLLEHKAVAEMSHPLYFRVAFGSTGNPGCSEEQKLVLPAATGSECSSHARDVKKVRPANLHGSCA